jgi:hypothetical protein
VSTVRPHPLPAHALLTRYSDNGAYADCFVADVAPGISHADYVTAFYTSWLFKLERLVLLCLVAKPSTDQQAGETGARRAETIRRLVGGSPRTGSAAGV